MHPCKEGERAWDHILLPESIQVQGRWACCVGNMAILWAQATKYRGAGCEVLPQRLVTAHEGLLLGAPWDTLNR